MPDPVVETPKVETPVVPPVPPAETPKVETPVVEVKPETPAAATKESWEIKRIAELTAKLAAERAEVAELRKQVKTPPAAVATPDIAPLVEQRASELVAQSEWVRICNEVADAGKKAFGEKAFQAKLDAVLANVDTGDNVEFQKYNDMLATMIETGSGPAILNKLGENPAEVKRLMSLSPVKQAMELTKLAATLNTPAAAADPSGAPAPIVPIDSKGLHYDGIDPSSPVNGTKLPIKVWMEQREKQAAAKGIQ